MRVDVALVLLAAAASAGARPGAVRPARDLYGGRVCLIAVDPATGRAAGASDPRGDGGLAEV